MASPKSWLAQRAVRRQWSLDLAEAFRHPAPFLEWCGSRGLRTPWGWDDGLNYGSLQSPFTEYAMSKVERGVYLLGSALACEQNLRFRRLLTLPPWALDLQQRMELIWPKQDGDRRVSAAKVVKVATGPVSDVLREASERVLRPDDFLSFLKRGARNPTVGGFLAWSLQADVASVTASEIQMRRVASQGGSWYGTFPPPPWVAAYLCVHPDGEAPPQADKAAMQADVVKAVTNVVDEALTVDSFATWLGDRRNEVIRSPIFEYIREKTRQIGISVDDRTWFYYVDVGWVQVRQPPFEGPLPEWVQPLPVSRNVTGQDLLDALGVN